MNLALRGMLALLMLLAAGIVYAQEGEPVSDEVVRDREFGVSARHFGLERRVEMYQWRAKDGGFERVWSESPIDCTGYAPGHDNPAFPLRGRRWFSVGLTLPSIASGQAPSGSSTRPRASQSARRQSTTHR